MEHNLKVPAEFIAPNGNRWPKNLARISGSAAASSI